MPDQDGFYHLTIRASCGVGSSRSSILPIDVEYDVSEFVEIHCGVCGCDLRVTYEGKPWTPMQLFLPFPVPRSVTATKDEPEPGDVPAKAVKKARSRKRNRSGPA